MALGVARAASGLLAAGLPAAGLLAAVRGVDARPVVARAEGVRVVEALAAVARGVPETAGRFAAAGLRAGVLGAAAGVEAADAGVTAADSAGAPADADADADAPAERSADEAAAGLPAVGLLAAGAPGAEPAADAPAALDALFAFAGAAAGGFFGVVPGVTRVVAARGRGARRAGVREVPAPERAAAAEPAGSAVRSDVVTSECSLSSP